MTNDNSPRHDRIRMSPRRRCRRTHRSFATKIRKFMGHQFLQSQSDFIAVALRLFILRKRRWTTSAGQAPRRCGEGRGIRLRGERTERAPTRLSRAMMGIGCDFRPEGMRVRVRRCSMGTNARTGTWRCDEFMHLAAKVQRTARWRRQRFADRSVVWVVRRLVMVPGSGGRRPRPVADHRSADDAGRRQSWLLRPGDAGGGVAEMRRQVVATALTLRRQEVVVRATEGRV